MSASAAWTDVPDGDGDGDLADERAVTVTGLVNGTEYAFEVRAANAEGGGTRTSVVLTFEDAGRDAFEVRAVRTTSLKLDSDDAIRATSSELDASLFFRVQGTQRGHRVDGGRGIAAGTVPGAPNVVATPGNAQVVLRWTAPDDGGQPVTGYRYRHSVGGTVDALAAWTDLGAAVGTVTVASLTNGTLYAFEVRAVNSVGDGAVGRRSTGSEPGPRGWRLGYSGTTSAASEGRSGRSMLSRTFTWCGCSGVLGSSTATLRTR